MFRFIYGKYGILRIIATNKLYFYELLQEIILFKESLPKDLSLKDRWILPHHHVVDEDLAVEPHCEKYAISALDIPGSVIPVSSS
jgi:hypothetical protein